MRKLPPLSAVRAFEAAARCLNYTRAGEELGLTQAGVSYQIKSLEQRVGMPLFVRNGRKMELTSAGAALAPRISQAFAAMEAAFREMSEDGEAILTIACFQTFATKWLAPRLGSFQIAHPHIAVRLEIANEFADLDAGECDLAIRLSDDVPDSLEAHVLAPLELAPFACPGFLKSHPYLCEYDPEISDADRISSATASWRAWDEARCAVRDGIHNLPRGLQFDSQILDAAAATGGNGVAILSPELFLTEVAEGKLQRVGEAVARPGAAYRLVYPPVRRNTEKVRSFRRWLMREFRDSVSEQSPDSGRVRG